MAIYSSFSINEIKKGNYNSKSLIVILFAILIIDSLRTIIESLYFGVAVSSKYGVLPIDIFNTLMHPPYILIPKILNVAATFAIIFLIFRKWYPEKLKEEIKLKSKFDEEKEILDRLVKEKTKELEELNKSLEERIAVEVEKRRIQEQKLFNQSKMAAMGEMIANIAHQWRQPLSAISTLSSGIKLKKELGLESDKELYKDLDTITKTITHMSNTIQDFQNFFKPKKDVSELTIKELVKNTLEILRPVIKINDIDVVLKIPSDIRINAPFNEFTHVLINLINNSKDAFINNNIEKRVLKIEVKQEVNLYVINIIDNAGGISQEIIDRIFEPYFTTKHQYHGTGLGLYMSKEIIENHMKGSLEVSNISFIHNNENHDGAQFTIKLKD